jgi:hypothetical protein
MNIVEPIIDTNITYIISNNRQNLYFINQNNEINEVNLDGLASSVSVNGVVYLANRIRDIVVFQDTILAAGDFGLKYWDVNTQKWQRYAIFTAGSSSYINNALFPNSIFQLAVDNNKLYILGNFVNAQMEFGGQIVSSPYIVAFNGSSFETINRRPSLPAIRVSSLQPKSSSFIYANDNIVSLYVKNDNIVILDKGFFNGRSVVTGTRGSDSFIDIQQNGSSSLYVINNGILTLNNINGTIVNDYQSGDDLFFVGLVNKNSGIPQTIYSKFNFNTKSLTRGYNIVNFDGRSQDIDQVAASVAYTGDMYYNISSRYLSASSSNYRSNSVYEFPLSAGGYKFSKVANNVSVCGGLNTSFNVIDNYEKSKSAIFIDNLNRLWFLPGVGHNIPLSQETRFGSGMILYDLDYGQLKLNGFIKEAVVGLDTIMVLTFAGEIYAWGTNSYGQLGENIPLGSSIDTPIKIDGDNYEKIYANNHTFYAIKTDGSMYAWGRNRIQFGSNTASVISMIPGQNSDVTTPTEIIIDLGSPETPLVRLGQPLNDDMGKLWDSVSIGPFSVYAIDKFGLLYHWGGIPNNIGGGYIQSSQTPANTYLKQFVSTSLISTQPTLLGCPAHTSDSTEISADTDPGKYLFVSHDSILLRSSINNSANTALIDGHIAIFSYSKDGQTYTEIWDKNIVDRDVETSTNFTTQAGINSLPTATTSTSIVSNHKSLSYNNIYSSNLQYLQGYRSLLVKFMFCDRYDRIISTQNPSPSSLNFRTNLRIAAIGQDSRLRLESGISVQWDYITKTKLWQSVNPYYAIDEQGDIFILPYGGSLDQAYPYVYPHRLVVDGIDDLIDNNKICDFASTNSAVSDTVIINNKLMIGGYLPSGNNFYADRHFLVYDISSGLVIDLDIPVDSSFVTNAVNQLIPLDSRVTIPPPPTPSNTPSNTPTYSATPSQTPTISQSATTTNTPTQTPTATPTVSESATNTPTPSVTKTLTPTRTTTRTPTPTPTVTQTKTPSNTPTMTMTSTKTPTPTITKTPTNSQTRVASWKKDGQSVDFIDINNNGVIPIDCECLADEYNQRNLNQ